MRIMTKIAKGAFFAKWELLLLKIEAVIGVDNVFGLDPFHGLGVSGNFGWRFYDDAGIVAWIRSPQCAAVGAKERDGWDAEGRCEVHGK